MEFFTDAIDTRRRCKTRGLCSSRAAKPGAVIAVLLAGEILEDISYGQSLFVMTKMLRSYFLNHRELFGRLARVIMRITDPRRHLVRYYGWYSNVSKGKCKRSLEGQSSKRRDPSPKAVAERRSGSLARGLALRCHVRPADR